MNRLLWWCTGDADAVERGGVEAGDCDFAAVVVGDVQVGAGRFSDAPAVAEQAAPVAGELDVVVVAFPGELIAHGDDDLVAVGLCGGGGGVLGWADVEGGRVAGSRWPGWLVCRSGCRAEPRGGAAAGRSVGQRGEERADLFPGLEELFTLVRGRRRQVRISAPIMATVPALADGQPAALIVAAIRGDFIDRASRFQPLEQAISSGPFTVTAMTESDLKEAITGPAIEAGIEVTDDLTAAILDDLRGRRVPGGYETGALPLLSHVLFKMWGQGGNNGLTLANYRRTGGVADIVRRSADAVYEKVGPRPTRRRPEDFHPAHRAQR